MYDLGENLQGTEDNTENRKSKVPVNVVTVYIYTASVKNYLKVAITFVL